MGNDLAPRFDLFLLRGCARALDADALGAPPLSPELAQAVLQSAALTAPPGFLGLTLEKRLAWDLMGRLSAAEGPFTSIGDIVEVAYRTPRVSIEEAYSIAEVALVAWRRAEGQRYAYAPLVHQDSKYHGMARWWVFFASSPELIELGYVPGGAMIYVDKVDGHVWTSQELDLVSWESERLLYLFPDWRDR